MEQHLPPKGQAEASEPHLVRYNTQAHPNDLVDPWWLDQTLIRGYGELLYRQWVTDLDEVTPEAVDERLPEGARLVRRAARLNAGMVECVFESEGALAAVDIRRRLLWVGVAAGDLAAGRRLLDAIARAFPEVEPATDDEGELPFVHLGVWGLRDDTRSARKHQVAPWLDIAANYAPATRSALAPVMEAGFAPDGRGQLLVWHGPPGTGKSFALGALAYAWRDWASFHYIADPESLLGDTSYLFEFILMRAPEDRWRVAVLEDTGELFGTDARVHTGQAIARLLNATDGMLAQDSKTLFVITTNERIGSFHPAVVRPGRCLSRVSFESLPPEQAKAWLLERGAAEVAKRLTGSATVAELYAMAAGELDPASSDARGGVYL